MRNSPFLVAFVLCAIISLAGCKKSLTEDPASHTNPLDPKTPNHINIVVDGARDAGYGAAVATDYVPPYNGFSCGPNMGTNIGDFYMVDSAKAWYLYLEVLNGLAAPPTTGPTARCSYGRRGGAASPTCATWCSSTAAPAR